MYNSENSDCTNTWNNSELRVDLNLLNGLKTLENIVVKNKSPYAKRVIYSAVTGDYDKGHPILLKDDFTDYIYFYDGNINKYPGWSYVKIPFTYRNEQRTAKALKVLPQYFLKSYSESIWVDGNIQIKKSLWPIMCSSNCDFAIFSHYSRNTVKEEVTECKRWRKDDKIIIDKQYNEYLKRGFNDLVGLYQGRIIYRKHNTQNIVHLMESWWKEIDMFSVRDQISLPYCLWKEKLYPEIIDMDANDNEYFEIIPHFKSSVKGADILTKMLALITVLVRKLPIFKRMGRILKNHLKI